MSWNLSSRRVCNREEPLVGTFRKGGEAQQPDERYVRLRRDQPLAGSTRSTGGREAVRSRLACGLSDSPEVAGAATATQVAHGFPRHWVRAPTARALSRAAAAPTARAHHGAPLRAHCASTRRAQCTRSDPHASRASREHRSSGACHAAFSCISNGTHVNYT